MRLCSNFVVAEMVLKLHSHEASNASGIPPECPHLLKTVTKAPVTLDELLLPQLKCHAFQEAIGIVVKQGLMHMRQPPPFAPPPPPPPPPSLFSCCLGSFCMHTRYAHEAGEFVISLDHTECPADPPDNPILHCAATFGLESQLMDCQAFAVLHQDARLTLAGLHPGCIAVIHSFIHSVQSLTSYIPGRDLASLSRPGSTDFCTCRSGLLILLRALTPHRDRIYTSPGTITRSSHAD